MRHLVVIATLFLASFCSPSVYGAISSQYHVQDHLGQYSYGYADPNSQKHESRSPDGVTKGSYSYVDGYGHIQSVSYVADPYSGFHATGTNLPKGPAPLYAGPNHLGYAGYAPYATYVPLTPQGVPVDTPEVQHAKAAHFAAHAAARSGHHLYKRSLWGAGYASPWNYGHVPVIGHNGVPLDTPEVQHAKAEHFAAHAKALGHAGAPRAPLDTPEVQHAKAAHFAAHAAARSGHPVLPAVAHGGYHIPVIHNGVPVETPEVQHAKAAHFAAVAEASSRAHVGGDDGGYYAPAHHGPIHIPVIHNGVPVETPEVQHAKAAHYAAVAEAQSRSHGSGYYGGGYDDGQYKHGW